MKTENSKPRNFVDFSKDCIKGHSYCEGKDCYCWKKYKELTINNLKLNP